MRNVSTLVYAERGLDFMTVAGEVAMRHGALTRIDGHRISILPKLDPKWFTWRIRNHAGIGV